jgi:hypothetical protein
MQKRKGAIKERRNNLATPSQMRKGVKAEKKKTGFLD